MRSFLLILLLASMCGCKEQGQVVSCGYVDHIYRTSAPNGVDSLGRRQGQWIIKPGVDGKQMLYQRGEYMDGVRTGPWQTYRYTYYFGDDVDIYMDHLYMPDGSVLERNYFDNYTAWYAPDSDLVRVAIACLQDSVYIQCIDKRSCSATYMESPLPEFDYSELGYMMMRGSAGEYDRILLHGLSKGAEKSR